MSFFSQGVIASLRRTTRSDWWQSLMLMLFSLIGGLAPLWIGAGLALIFGKDFSLAAFSASGEFAIYGAAIVAPTLYSILHERTPQRLSGQTALAAIAIALLLVAITAYLAVVPLPSRVLTLEGLDVELYSKTCTYLLAISIGFAVLVTALDNGRTNPDVRALSTSQENSLRAEFDRIKDQP